MKHRVALLAVVLVPLTAAADGPADNAAANVRPVPPAGIALSDPDRRALESALAPLAQELRALEKVAAAKPHLPDIQIFYQAVRIAIDEDEFFDAKEIPAAKKLIALGRERARALARGKTPWLHARGPTALGYRSALDGSVQPYGLFLPETYAPAAPVRWRLDSWFHGRAEKLSEVNFLDGVLKGAGEFVRPNALILQPYGRFCNGSKLAGEVDFFEALADVKRRYRIDEDRIVVRGFSLGGASTWHLAAHFASDWAAAAPGAGFSETPEFLKVFQNETLTPTWWERKLWQLYDAPAYAENFRNVPVVAYSGAADRQKQAADVMVAALEKIGIPLVHVVGPGTAHKYHPDSIAEINRLVDALAERGRDPAPRRVSVTTPTLKYNRQAWITLEGLGRHWEKATVEGELIADGEVRLTTKNVTALALQLPAARAPFALGRPVTVVIDGQRLTAPAPSSDRSFSARFHRAGARWQPGALADDGLARKQHNLQGPIDDAFLTPFLIVTPTGGGISPVRPGFKRGAYSRDVSRWATGEQTRAIKEWRRHFRGEARIKADIDVTANDLVNYNLVLWGDPGNNLLLAQIADRLPIAWTRESITVGRKQYPTATHALMAVYPNPLWPRRYVVLNSGFTFREYDYLNNARQVPKLPDWAIVDTTTPPDSRTPGKIVDAGFFGERWELISPPAKMAPAATTVARRETP